MSGQRASFAEVRVPRPSNFKLPFLRIPPFPGARLGTFREGPGKIETADAIIAALRRFRVGGSYWSAQPELPENYVLVRSQDALDAAAVIARGLPVILWKDGCDPWHMLSGAAALVADEDDEAILVAALMDVRTYRLDPLTGRVEPYPTDTATLVSEAVAATYDNPFTGEPMDPCDAIALCGFWRALIDSNRAIGGGIGFAFWKQDRIAPLLWDGSVPFRFLRTGDRVQAGKAVAAWRSKASPAALETFEGASVPLIEVEDGFLRSRGLGADCVPPLSIAVDRRGSHFDPRQPSDLECLIEDRKVDVELVARARKLREIIVDTGIGKYERGTVELVRPAGERRHILVPGQVEDDRAVLVGGCGLTSNLELLKRVRAEAPDAYILYKPHPDVLAGHRRGAISQGSCLEHADEIVGELPIASLIAMVDEVHVNTSLAGFEALLRGKSVTTYGVPFYAGWGLTRDLGPVPERRTARPTIDELAAAALVLYPRYLDPVTGLPCPAEIVVARLGTGAAPDSGLIVGMRRLQGKVMRRLRSLVQ